MERLTKRIDLGDGKYTVDFSNERCVEFLGDHKAGVRALFERLADYEDAEEQGLLIRLPCKPTKTLYEIECDCELSECYCRNETCTKCQFGHWHIEPIILGTKSQIVLHMKEFDKTIFLTREKAEATLKEMEK